LLTLWVPWDRRLLIAITPPALSQNRYSLSKSIHLKMDRANSHGIALFPLALGFGPVRQSFQREQEVLMAPGPGQLRRFFQEDPFVQEMDVTERMSTAMAFVGRPAIMDAGALVARQDTVGIQPFGSSLGMHLIGGQPAGRGHMHPDTLACHREPALVLMDHRGLPQGDLDLMLNRLQHLCTAAAHLVGGPSLLGEPTRSERISAARLNGRR
jgi:hypothetical protein